MTDAATPPPNWAEDHLSRFQNYAARNEWATFYSYPQLWALFQAIDAAIFSYADARIGRMANEPTKDPTAALLLCNAHSHYRATLRLCSSGHALPVFSTGRSALESALYGWYLGVKPDAIPRWKNKPAGGTARREWGNVFAFGPITRHLQSTSPNTATRAKQLHEQAIAFGSHPNTEALTSNIGLHQGPEGPWFGIKYLHGWGAPFATAARFCGAIGLTMLEVVMLTEPDSDEVAALAAVFPSLCGQLHELQLQWEQEFSAGMQGA